MQTVIPCSVHLFQIWLDVEVTLRGAFAPFLPRGQDPCAHNADDQCEAAHDDASMTPRRYVPKAEMGLTYESIEPSDCL